MKNLRKLLGQRGTLLFGAGVVSSLVQSLAEYSMAVFLMLFLFTLGFVSASKLPSWLPAFLLESPLNMWGALFLIVTVKAAMEIIASQSKFILSQLVYARLRMVLGYQILKQEDNDSILPFSEINLYMTDYFPKTASFILYFSQSVSFCIQAMVVIGGMLFFAWAEAVVGIAGLCLMGLFVLRLNRLNQNVSRKIPEIQSRLERLKVRIIRNWLLIKILKLENTEYEKFMDSVILYFRHSIVGCFYGSLGGALMPMLGVIVIALIVILSGQVFNTPAVNLVAFLYLFARFTQKVANVSNLMGGLFTYSVQFKNAMAIFSSLPGNELKKALAPEQDFSFLGRDLRPDSTSPLRKAGGALLEQKDRVPPSIQVEGIAFSWYKREVPVFQNLSLQIHAGSQFAIVGPNGSGKSTLLGVVLGVLKPSAGRVLVGGFEAEEYLKRQNESIGYVGAEPYLIYGSVRKNLTYGLEGTFSEEEIWDVLEAVKLDDFVRELPGGLDSRIEENGDGLSSGQKQRLAIARAFFRRPSLLILDEPSSNLDEATELVVFNALRELKGRCTVLIVSHRPEILKGADAVLDLGRIGDVLYFSS